MRLLRHLAAAALVVAVVVVLGLAWSHFAASTLIGGLQGPSQAAAGQHVIGPPGVMTRGGAASPPGVVIRGGAASPHGPEVIRLGGTDLGLGSMLDPVNLPYLRHTVAIEAAVIAAVVIIDASRRRSRRAERAARLADDDAAEQ